MGMLRRYELHGCADQTFETLSGGQQARFQILLLELEGATMLLLDEPTDNLDLVSAEALETGLAEFKGTVVAVTHDRWFLRNFDRFLVFADDCSVLDLPEPWQVVPHAEKAMASGGVLCAYTPSIVQTLAQGIANALGVH